MLSYRPAKLADVPVIADMAATVVKDVAMEQHVSTVELRCNVAECIGHPSHFAWVAEEGGQVSSVVIVHVSKLPWSSKHSANIAMLCSKMPGAGMQLLGRAFEWIRSRPVIKTACIELLSPDDRLKRALKRMGFTRETTNMVWVR